MAAGFQRLSVCVACPGKTRPKSPFEMVLYDRPALKRIVSLPVSDKRTLPPTRGANMFQVSMSPNPEIVVPVSRRFES